MEALVWPSMIWFRSIPFGAVQLGASYANWRRPHIFKCQMYKKIVVLCLSKYSNESFHNQHWIISEVPFYIYALRPAQWLSPKWSSFLLYSLSSPIDWWVLRKEWITERTSLGYLYPQLVSTNLGVYYYLKFWKLWMNSLWSPTLLTFTFLSLFVLWYCKIVVATFTKQQSLCTL